MIGFTIRAAAMAVVALAAFASTTVAQAATSATSVTSVNLRAGPSPRYPVVLTMPAGAQMRLYGCTANTRWCDVSWGGDRGWVASNHVQVAYRGSYTVVTPAVAPAVGVAVAAFSYAYWNDHYVGRPWYGHWRTHYSRVAVGGCGDRGCGGVVAGPRGVAAGGCGERSCAGAVAGPRRAAAGGCGERGCAGVVAGPRGVKAGHCSDGRCSGTKIRRGPQGGFAVRHGAIGRR